MSTRSQVYMKDSGVYLYQHMDGYNLPNEVKMALQRDGCRTDDDEYLAAVIFKEMLLYDARWTIEQKRRSGEDITDTDRQVMVQEAATELIHGTTGFGIGNEIHGDIEWLVTVSVSGQTIEVLHRTWDGNEIKKWTFTFNEFINNDIHNWDAAGECTDASEVW